MVSPYTLPSEPDHDNYKVKSINNKGEDKVLKNFSDF